MEEERGIVMDKTKFVGYEYKTVTVRTEMEGLWVDSERNFGWELDKKEPAIVKHVWGPLRVMLAPLALLPGSQCDKLIVDRESEKKVVLTFKRDRMTENKDKLGRLETGFERSAAAIDALEAAKTAGGTAAAYAAGLLGTVFMGISVFSYLGGMLPLCILFAVPGFIGWVLPPFLKHMMVAKKTRAVQPHMEKQHEDIYQICREANVILRSA